MCRARHERPPDGRRCPAHADPGRRALGNLRQRIGRYDRALRQAIDAEDWGRVDRYAGMLDRDVAALAAHTQTRETAAPVPPTRVAEFTPEAAGQLTDDELVTAYAELDHDPLAQEQIVETLDLRDDLRRRAEEARLEQAAREAAEQERRREAERVAAEIDARDDASPLTNPTVRPLRKLTPEQQCREAYDSYVTQAYLDAETECRGQLLSRDGLRKDIDPESLFSGPAARAAKYASEELHAWWAQHGRVTYSEWKYQWFGRESDRRAARTARHATQQGLVA